MPWEQLALLVVLVVLVLVVVLRWLAGAGEVDEVGVCTR
jgi:hypothetical protein